MTIRWPGNGGTFRYGSPLPYHRLPPLPAIAALRWSRSLVAAQHLLRHAADDPLLGRDVAGRVDDAEIEFTGEPVVDVEDAALEQPEALDRVGREPEVHAGLVVLELRPAAEQAIERDLDRHAKV